MIRAITVILATAFLCLMSAAMIQTMPEKSVNFILDHWHLFALVGIAAIVTRLVRI